MSILNWLQSLIPGRSAAMRHYRAGMIKAKKQDYAGAIEEYSASIRDPKIPIDVKAMALYNRGLAYSAIHDTVKADEDLLAVQKMPGLPERIKKAATQRRERLRRRTTTPNTD